jgi:hypothetical protein
MGPEAQGCRAGEKIRNVEDAEKSAALYSSGVKTVPAVSFD